MEASAGAVSSFLLSVGRANDINPFPSTWPSWPNHLPEVPSTNNSIWSFKTCKYSDLSRNSFLLFPELSLETGVHSSRCTPGTYIYPQNPKYSCIVGTWGGGARCSTLSSPGPSVLSWWSCSLVSVPEASFCLLGFLVQGSPGMTFHLWCLRAEALLRVECPFYDCLVCKQRWRQLLSLKHWADPCWEERWPLECVYRPGTSLCQESLHLRTQACRTFPLPPKREPRTIPSWADPSHLGARAHIPTGHTTPCSPVQCHLNWNRF